MVETFHLPGKHDQSSHSRGKRKSSTPSNNKSDDVSGGGGASGNNNSTSDELTVIKGKNPERDWRAETDPDKRAAAVWQHHYEDMQAVRGVHANLEAGRAPFDGVTLDPTRVSMITKPIRGKQVYNEQDYRNDLVNSATRLGAGVRNGSLTSATSYRAMRVDDPASLFKEGSVHTTGLSSFKDSRLIGGYFKSEKGVRTGKAQVALELKPGARVMSVQSASDFESELITSGSLRVTKITPPPELPKVNAYGWVYNQPVWVVEVEQI